MKYNIDMSKAAQKGQQSKFGRLKFSELILPLMKNEKVYISTSRHVL
jgi:hypothetical protein